ncbi:MAG: hypothetical protein ABFC89_12140 [Methanospirillum sp.]
MPSTPRIRSSSWTHRAAVLATASGRTRIVADRPLAAVDVFPPSVKGIDRSGVTVVSSLPRPASFTPSPGRHTARRGEGRAGAPGLRR